MTICFTTCLEQTWYPQFWTMSALQPIFKKVNVNNPKEYCMIALLDTQAKQCFNIMLDKMEILAEEA